VGERSFETPSAPGWPDYADCAVAGLCRLCAGRFGL